MDDEVDLQDPETVMRDARRRFLEGFPGRVRSIGLLFNAMSSPDGGDASQPTVRRMAHQMAGIAGTLGLPAVSETALALEQLVIAGASGQSGVEPAAFERALALLTESCQSDLAKPEPSWARTSEQSAGPRVLLADADEGRRKTIAAWLRNSRYQVSATGDGREAFTHARIDRPAAVILDADAPGIDAPSICRKVKSSPDLADTPVIFMTAKAGEIGGAALGADAHLAKPIDETELLQCLELSVGAREKTAPQPSGFLTFEALALAAQDLFRRDSCALALVRLPAGQESLAVEAIAKVARRADLVAIFDASHAVWLFAGGTESDARLAVNSALSKCPGLRAAVAVAVGPGPRSLEALLAEADPTLNGGQNT
jgi:CheY-like chemotaxis protein